MKVKNKLPKGECNYCGEKPKAWFQGKKVCKNCWRRLKSGGSEYLKDKLEEDKKNGGNEWWLSCSNEI